MYSQAFSPSSLLALLHPQEVKAILHNLDGKKQFELKLAEKCKKIKEDCSFDFNIAYKNSYFTNGHPLLSTDYIIQELVLRKIHYNIKEVYKIKQANRNRIIRQISVLMEDTYPSYIVRLDIRSFYESIDRIALLNKLKDDVRLTYPTISLLESLFNNTIIKDHSGLPRGLSISAVLSEHFLKYFDLNIQKEDGVYYYARYVDDMVIFCKSKPIQSKIPATISDLLSNLNLELNNQKTQLLEDNNISNQNPLNYLGYAMYTEKAPKKSIEEKDKRNIIQIAITEQKIKKIKTRLVRSFVCYTKNKDFELLKHRIQYLTGNFQFTKQHLSMIIKSGIFYNYQMLSNDGEKQLHKLDIFYQHLLHCKKGKLGNLISAYLKKEQIHYLEKYSFAFGFQKRIIHKFSKDEINEIKKIWQ